MLTLSEKRKVGRFVCHHYSHVNGRRVRFGGDGAVSCMVDQMPNTTKPGRIFVGWDTELLRQRRGC